MIIGQKEEIAVYTINVTIDELDHIHDVSCFDSLYDYHMEIPRQVGAGCMLQAIDDRDDGHSEEASSVANQLASFLRAMPGNAEIVFIPH